MTPKLTFEELELACRLLPRLVDKRDLTTGHEWQEFAAIRRNTRHIKLVRMGIAEMVIERPGVILLRRGSKWAFDAKDDNRILRDRMLVQRLEIRAWLRQWFPERAAQRRSYGTRLRTPPAQSSALVLRKSSNVIPFWRNKIDRNLGS